MPFVHIRPASARSISPEQVRHLQAEATRLMASTMRKKAAVLKRRAGRMSMDRGAGIERDTRAPRSRAFVIITAPGCDTTETIRLGHDTKFTDREILRKHRGLIGAPSEMRATHGGTDQVPSGRMCRTHHRRHIGIWSLPVNDTPSPAAPVSHFWRSTVQLGHLLYRRTVIARTRRALAALPECLVKDMGLTRCDIARVAGALPHAGHAPARRAPRGHNATRNERAAAGHF